MSTYNKDKDLSQNMRDVWDKVNDFKRQVDAIVLASGYGGWTFATTYLPVASRIDGLLYLFITEVGTEVNDNGDTVPKYSCRAEDAAGTVVRMHSQADIVVYDNTGSNLLTATNVQDAIDELSHRSFFVHATVPASVWRIATVADGVTSVNGTDPIYIAPNISAPGMLNTDYPAVTVDASTDPVIAAREFNAASHITRVTTQNNNVTCYSYDGIAPKQDLNLLFKVTRG
jgi:hypothetical protein